MKKKKRLTGQELHDHMKSIGERGGVAGSGASKYRPGAAENLRKYRELKKRVSEMEKND